MKSFAQNVVWLLLMFCLVQSCSTQKNNAGSRAYHQLISHYNIFFNAKESYKAGIKKVKNSVTEDYTRIIPLFIADNPVTAQVSSSELEYTVQKCLKLIATQSITQSPKRKINRSERYSSFASKKEFNKWIDDGYLLIGKASYSLKDFHRAKESFLYILNNFPTYPSRNYAFLWLARTYMATGETEKCLEIFKMLERDGTLPEGIIKELALAKANYFIQSSKWSEAITQMKSALTHRFGHDEMTRYHFILGQLYKINGQTDESILEFQWVSKHHAPFDMEFNARISALELVGDSSDIVGPTLDRMLKNSNYKRFFDRIYYAKGQIALKEQKRDEAIALMIKSVAYATDNNYQRALSCLNVAQLLFEEPDYPLSSAYYDSAMVVIDDNYPNYNQIVSRANGLAKLVINLETISKEDSLQRIAALPEAERMQLINALIQKKAEEERALAQELSAQTNEQNYFRGEQYRQQPGGVMGIENNALWYFYNPVTAGNGKREFQRLWGKRKLEDNWRRKNRLSANFNESEQSDQDVAGIKTDSKTQKEAPGTVEFYLRDLPVNDSLLYLSNDRIKSAFFAVARIYASVLEDFPKSITALEELNSRFPGSEYELSSWIEFYKMNYQTDLFKAKIIEKYPENNYAKYLVNPNFFQDLEILNKKLGTMYNQAFEFYKNGEYDLAGKLAEEVVTMKPDTSLMSKAKYIALIAKGRKLEKIDFVKELDQYIADYPSSSTIEMAIHVRNLVRDNAFKEYGEMIRSGYIKEKVDTASTTTQAPNRADAFGGKFSYDEDLFHYFIMAFPREAKVDVNRLIFDIANFNIDYYTSFDFDIEQINLNDQTTMVVVRSLPNREEGMMYWSSISKKSAVFQALKDVNYLNFYASSTNFRVILTDKNLEEYLKFFVIGLGHKSEK